MVTLAEKMNPIEGCTPNFFNDQSRAKYVVATAIMLIVNSLAEQMSEDAKQYAIAAAKASAIGCVKKQEEIARISKFTSNTRTF